MNGCIIHTLIQVLLKEGEGRRRGERGGRRSVGEGGERVEGGREGGRDEGRDNGGRGKELIWL